MVVMGVAVSRESGSRPGRDVVKMVVTIWLAAVVGVPTEANTMGGVARPG
jgi:hypothetical protein